MLNQACLFSSIYSFLLVPKFFKTLLPASFSQTLKSVASNSREVTHTSCTALHNEATPGVAGAVLASSARGKHRHSGESPKSHKDNEGTGHFLLWGKAERAGPVQPGDKMTQGDPINVCKFLKGEYEVDGARLFTVVLSDRTRGTGHKLKHRRCCVSCRKHVVS